jgi:uncharacterized protein (DUF2249 family)
MPHTESISKVNVRSVPPRERHALIFSIFRRLAVSESMELVNDHDPLPLYDQFQLEAPNGFAWDYLERGPNCWRVSITRLARPHTATSCCGACGGA